MSSNQTLSLAQLEAWFDQSRPRSCKAAFDRNALLVLHSHISGTQSYLGQDALRDPVRLARISVDFDRVKRLQDAVEVLLADLPGLRAQRPDEAQGDYFDEALDNLLVAAADMVPRLLGVNLEGKISWALRGRQPKSWQILARRLADPVRDVWRSAGFEPSLSTEDGPLVKVLCRILELLTGEMEIPAENLVTYLGRHPPEQVGHYFLLK